MLATVKNVFRDTSRSFGVFSGKNGCVLNPALPSSSAINWRYLMQPFGLRVGLNEMDLNLPTRGLFCLAGWYLESVYVTGQSGPDGSHTRSCTCFMVHARFLFQCMTQSAGSLIRGNCFFTARSRNLICSAFAFCEQHIQIPGLVINWLIPTRLAIPTLPRASYFLTGFCMSLHASTQLVINSMLINGF